MSDRKHTPGPWKVISEAAAREVEVFEIAEISHFRVVCEERGDGFDVAGDPFEDARLIAAAPDLLASLREMTPSLPPADAPCHFGIVEQAKCGHCGRIRRALAAIAKALGSQST